MQIATAAALVQDIPSVFQLALATNTLDGNQPLYELPTPRCHKEIVETVQHSQSFERSA